LLARARVEPAAQPGQLVPVDSEHSAIAQCLRGGSPAEVDRLVLTASGGPFRGWSADRLAGVTVAQALAHPTWDMGPVVTLNSSTLVNKGLELIEAHLLFGIPYDRIDVVVHPQSVVHSMVTFADGATIAQASPPDMHLPIALGLAWPDRLGGVADACDWSRASSWTFEPLDNEVFPAVRLARAAGTAGGTAPAVYNAATYLGIVETVGAVLDAHITVSGPTLEQVRAADAWAREAAARLIGSTDSGAVMSAGTDA
jgi:1-deoxy-D-xylulose-5-phosphate reductoisomerase